MSMYDFDKAADLTKAANETLEKLFNSYREEMKGVFGDAYCGEIVFKFAPMILNSEPFPDFEYHWYSEESNKTYTERKIKDTVIKSVASGRWIKTEEGWKKVEETV